jgi:phage shock protein C
MSETFIEAPKAEEPINAQTKAADLKWIRVSEGSILAGVCTGLARSLNMDVALMRVLFVVGCLCFGIPLLTYVILAIAFPLDTRLSEAHGRMLLGVCASIAKRSGIEIGAVRLIAILLFLSSGGSAVLGYIILYFALPAPPTPVV